MRAVTVPARPFVSMVGIDDVGLLRAAAEAQGESVEDFAGSVLGVGAKTVARWIERNEMQSTARIVCRAILFGHPTLAQELRRAAER